MPYACSSTLDVQSQGGQHLSVDTADLWIFELLLASPGASWNVRGLLSTASTSLAASALLAQTQFAGCCAPRMVEGLLSSPSMLGAMAQPSHSQLCPHRVHATPYLSCSTCVFPGAAQAPPSQDSHHPCSVPARHWDDKAGVWGLSINSSAAQVPGLAAAPALGSPTPSACNGPMPSH